MPRPANSTVHEVSGAPEADRHPLRQQGNLIGRMPTAIKCTLLVLLQPELRLLVRNRYRLGLVDRHHCRLSSHSFVLSFPPPNGVTSCHFYSIRSPTNGSALHPD
jgi:hypothetical protein